MGNTEKFDMISSNYDTAQRINIANVCVQAIKEIVDNPKSKNAIDFGCGTGLVGINLINDFQNVIFIDTSQKMLDIVDEKLKKLDIKNASTLCFDSESVEESAHKADLIFIVQVLLHIRDYKATLIKIAHMLNSNGQLIIIDFDKNDAVSSDFVHNGFSQDILKGVLTEIGFKNILSHIFHSEENLLMGKHASLFIMKGDKTAL